MKKYEYTVLELRPKDAPEQLDLFGNAGWLLVAVQGTKFYLVREKGKEKKK